MWKVFSFPILWNMYRLENKKLISSQMSSSHFFFLFLIGNKSNIIDEKRNGKYKVFIMMNTGKQ